jgi:hypothetical protein
VTPNRRATSFVRKNLGIYSTMVHALGASVESSVAPAA